ncbi:MAG: YHS domain protein [Chitinophagaceae bacterium]|nr:YHS domain protein [Chitinophagaceae bacterium]
MKHLFILFLFLTTASFSIIAQKPPVYSTENGAINGYDPVAYFKESLPVQGKDGFQTEWKNARWKFASKANLDTFIANPDRFVPQYGGYCAYGASNNYKAPTSADAWAIVEGKLYLNYNKNVQKEWIKTSGKRIRDADLYWPDLVNK